MLVAKDWLDEGSISRLLPSERQALSERGYMPSKAFNRVLDVALGLAGLSRSDIYVTQAFHLINRSTSGQLSGRAVDICFDAVTRHEAVGRRVVALGGDAAAACRRHGIVHFETLRPSARGLSHLGKGAIIAEALIKALGS